jgi:bacillithiol system protein YtxJ
MKVIELKTVDDVDKFLLENPTSAFFKAGSCHKTMQGYAIVQEALKGRYLRVGCVRVVECRPASNHIALRTGVKHESPQFILMIEGEAVFDLDNWEITPDAMQEGVEAHLGKGNCTAKPLVRGDVAVYTELLEKYVAGTIEEETFQNEWLITFRDDATLRSQEEFEMLNSLFGDVDKALEYGVRAELLKERAEQILRELKK